MVAGFAVSTAHFGDAVKKNVYIIALTSNESPPPPHSAVSRDSSHLSPRLVEASVLSVIELIPHFRPTPAINLMITRRVEDFFFPAFLFPESVSRRKRLFPASSVNIVSAYVYF